MSYAETQRLRLIEFLVDHYGTVRRSAVMDYFGVSQPQASADLKRYMELAPKNLVYDTSKKAYVRSVGFARVWL
jgi:hypothetical protein